MSDVRERLADAADFLRRCRGTEPAEFYEDHARTCEDAAALLASSGETDFRAAYMNARTCICGEDAGKHLCPDGTFPGVEPGFDPDWQAMRERYFDLRPSTPVDALREAFCAGAVEAARAADWRAAPDAFDRWLATREPT